MTFDYLWELKKTDDYILALVTGLIMIPFVEIENIRRRKCTIGENI